jgi:DNA-binding CsgD family transcriptional regulator
MQPKAAAINPTKVVIFVRHDFGTPVFGLKENRLSDKPSLMSQMTLFVLVLSFGVGLAAIAVSAQVYRRYRFGYLRAHLAVVVTFNLMILVNIIALYVFSRPEGTVPDPVDTGTGILYQLLVPLLQLLATYYLMQIIRGLLGQDFPGRTRKVALGVIATCLLVQGIAIAARIEVASVPLSRVISRLVWFSTIGLVYTILLTTMGEIGTVPDRQRRHALRAYWLLLLGLITVVLVLVSLSYFGMLTATRQNFLTGFVIVAMNAVPILYLAWFADRFHATPPSEPVTVSDPTPVFQRYDISAREQEVVRLICSGKSNKEIAAELFISLQTVKDHVYRVFKKTGVKNRVQLANLFRKPLDK